MASITMYPAGNGDSFLVEHGAVSILIDGGYSSTFEQHILPDLRELAKRSRHLDLVVATHIDADHISGIVRLFEQNGFAESPRIVSICGVWHNSLACLGSSLAPSGALSKGDEDLLREITRRGYQKTTEKSSLEVEISALQGSSLAALLRTHQFIWNGSDGTIAIAAPYSAQLSSDVNVTVLGPTSERLSQFRDWWINQLRKLGYAGVIDKKPLIEDVFEFLCSYEAGQSKAAEISGKRPVGLELIDVYEPDDSIVNASSITFVIKMGSSRLLFLGDSWALDCEAAIRQLYGSCVPLVFDAIKVSHHGSYRNTSPELLDMIDSPNFLISTNGERHNHPDIEVLKALVDRPAEFSRNIYFNSTTPSSRALQSHVSKSGVGFTVHDNYQGQIEIR